MQDKTLKLIIIIALVFSIISISACIFMYQKAGGNQIIPEASVVADSTNAKNASIKTGQNGAVVYDVKIPEKAGGFLGLTESQDIKIDGDNKKIQLRGHWTADNKPTFDFIGDSNYQKASSSLPLRTIVINKDTKIVKLVFSGKEIDLKGTAISLANLKIESSNDPIFAIFSEQTKTDQNELVAAQLIIFSGYSQSTKK